MFNTSADWLNPFASREIASQLELEENKSCLCLSVRDFGRVDFNFGAFAILPVRLQNTAHMHRLNERKATM